MPREQILSRIHRVAFGPIEPSALGWDVVDSDTLNAVLGKAIREGNAFYDPLTGTVLPAAASSCCNSSPLRGR